MVDKEHTDDVYQCIQEAIQIAKKEGITSYIVLGHRLQDRDWASETIRLALKHIASS